MTILKQMTEKTVVYESAQERNNGHRIGVKLCEDFFAQAQKSSGDVAALKDSLAGLLDGCNEVLLKYVDNNKFKNNMARDVISRISVALDDSFTEIQKIRA